MSPGQHFIENDPEREEVATRIDLPPLDLFRRHVGDGSEDLTGKTERRLSLSSVLGAMNVESVVHVSPGHSRRGIRAARPKSSTFT